MICLYFCISVFLWQLVNSTEKSGLKVSPLYTSHTFNVRHTMSGFPKLPQSLQDIPHDGFYGFCRPKGGFCRPSRCRILKVFRNCSGLCQTCGLMNWWPLQAWIGFCRLWLLDWWVLEILFEVRKACYVSSYQSYSTNKRSTTPPPPRGS